MASVTLPSGSVMPLNGFGTWRAEPGLVGKATRVALDVGYRHIDCAAIYMNEPEVGAVFKEYFSGESPKIRREDVFITSKVWNSCHKKENVIKSCRQTLEDLQLDYLDLFLVHFPISWKFGGLPITEDTWIKRKDDGTIDLIEGVTLQETWEGMEECLRLGLVKNIGVSNFPVFILCDMLNYCKVKPAVNQCECHLMHQREDLRKICEQFGIHFTAYSTLGSGRKGPLQNETVRKIADRHRATPAQICLAWVLSLGASALAKSVNEDRIKANFSAVKIKLTEEDFSELAKLEERRILCDPKDFWDFAALA